MICANCGNECKSYYWVVVSDGPGEPEYYQQWCRDCHYNTFFSEDETSGEVYYDTFDGQSE